MKRHCFTHLQYIHEILKIKMRTAYSYSVISYKDNQKYNIHKFVFIISTLTMPAISLCFCILSENNMQTSVWESMLYFSLTYVVDKQMYSFNSFIHLLIIPESITGTEPMDIEPVITYIVQCIYMYVHMCRTSSIHMCVCVYIYICRFRCSHNLKLISILF